MDIFVWKNEYNRISISEDKSNNVEIKIGREHWQSIWFSRSEIVWLTQTLLGHLLATGAATLQELDSKPSDEVISVKVNARNILIDEEVE